MRIVLSLLFILSFHFLYSQSGCTDSNALNFDPNALQNNGSCTYSPSQADFTLKGAFSSVISESSGVAFFNGDILTHNDSGNGPEIFIVDSANGNLKQTIIVDNYSNTDWEDICVDENYIYVGDFGNNGGSRKDLKILKIKRSDITTATTIHVNAEAINFSYADQTSYISSSSNNFDCESIFSMGDSLYILSKDRGDGKTRVYKTSKIPSTYILSYYTEFDVHCLITGADYNPKTKEVALIGYDQSKFSSYMWILSDFKKDDFLGGNKKKFIASNFHYWQTEGIAFDTINNKIFISCESAGFVLASLFTLNHTEAIPTDIQPSLNEPSFQLFPNPATEYIQITNLRQITSIEIYDIMGQVIFSEPVSTNTYRLQLNRNKFIAGMYFIRINGADYQSQQSFILK